MCRNAHPLFFIGTNYTDTKQTGLNINMLSSDDVNIGTLDNSIGNSSFFTIFVLLN